MGWPVRMIKSCSAITCSAQPQWINGYDSVSQDLVRRLALGPAELGIYENKPACRVLPPDIGRQLLDERMVKPLRFAQRFLGFFASEIRAEKPLGAPANEES